MQGTEVLNSYASIKSANITESELTVVSPTQGHLGKHNAELAAAALVKACALSTFALGILNDNGYDWAKVLHDLDMGYFPLMYSANTGTKAALA